MFKVLLFPFYLLYLISLVVLFIIGVIIGTIALIFIPNKCSHCKVKTQVDNNHFAEQHYDQNIGGLCEGSGKAITKYKFWFELIEKNEAKKKLRQQNK